MATLREFMSRLEEQSLVLTEEARDLIGRIDAESDPEDGSISAFRCVVRMLTDATTASRLLSVRQFADESDFGEMRESGDRIRTVDLLSLTLNTVERFGHGRICSVHVLATALDLLPSVCRDVIHRLADLYRATRPLGTERQRRLVDFADRVGREDWARSIRRDTVRTPFTVERVKTEVSTFLSSEYYPYGSVEYGRYQSESKDVSILRCFLAAGEVPYDDSEYDDL